MDGMVRRAALARCALLCLWRCAGVQRKCAEHPWFAHWSLRTHAERVMAQWVPPLQHQKQKQQEQEQQDVICCSGAEFLMNTVHGTPSYVSQEPRGFMISCAIPAFFASALLGKDGLIAPACLPNTVGIPHQGNQGQSLRANTETPVRTSNSVGGGVDDVKRCSRVTFMADAYRGRGPGRGECHVGAGLTAERSERTWGFFS